MDSEEKPLAQRAGEMLKVARCEKCISLQDAADYLRLRKAMVVALEEDDYEQWSSWVYFRGHLQRYAKWLDVDFVLLKRALGPECFDVLLPEPDVIVKQVSVWEKYQKPIVFGSMIIGLLVVLIAGVELIHYWRRPHGFSMVGRLAKPVAAVQSTDKRESGLAKRVEQTTPVPVVETSGGPSRLAAQILNKDSAVAKDKHKKLSLPNPSHQLVSASRHRQSDSNFDTKSHTKSHTQSHTKSHALGHRDFWSRSSKQKESRWARD